MSVERKAVEIWLTLDDYKWLVDHRGWASVNLYAEELLLREVGRQKISPPRLCPCGCGQELHGRQQSATEACRKRLQRYREQDLASKSHS